MTAVQVAAAVVALLGGAGWCFVRSLRRAPRSLGAARRQMFGVRPGDPSPTGLPAWIEGVGARPVSWVERSYGAGLDVVGLTAVDVVTRAFVAAAGMLLVLCASVTTLVAIGLLPASLVWYGAAVVMSALAAWTMVRDVGSRIERRRRELHRAANDLVQLVAVGLTTDQSVEEAIRFAVRVGVGDAFDVIRREVESAPQRGVPLWDAIDAVGRRYGVRELCEFAASVERQGLHGVSISETVASMAAAMRATALDELEREADRANANLSGPTIGFVVTTIVFLAYPLAERISAAFGG